VGGVDEEELLFCVGRLGGTIVRLVRRN
jgi:hypothetical protein